MPTRTSERRPERGDHDGTAHRLGRPVAALLAIALALLCWLIVRLR